MLTAILAASVISLASPSEIQRSLDTYVSKTPGVVVVAGVVDHGAVHVYKAGTPPSGAPALNENTGFQIGSISKTFTATLLAEMVQRRQVKLSDPISKYLPQGVHAPTYRGKEITLLNLAEQNSGLPRLPENMTTASAADPYASYSAEDLYDFLNHYELTRAPGAKYEYSNLGVGLLGQLLANAAHTTYADLVQSRIFNPLHMTESSAGLTTDVRTNMMPGLTSSLQPQAPWTFTALAGAGAINSTLHDMLLYVQANMKAPAGPLGKAMAAAQEPRSTTEIPNSKIGLAWMTTEKGLVWHSGETGGYSSFVGFAPKDGVGVVVLTNVAPMKGETDTLALHLIEPSAAPTVVAVAGPEKPHGNSPMIGVYELSPQFSITIYEEGGTLYGQGTNQPAFSMIHDTGDTYKINGVEASITFERDASGKVTSLILHQNGRDVPGKRVNP